jgi:hypothetical protein
MQQNHALLAAVCFCQPEPAFHGWLEPGTVMMLARGTVHCGDGLPVGAPSRVLVVGSGTAHAVADETLSRIETGARPSVSMGVATRLSDSLGVPLTDLFAASAERDGGDGALRPGERALLALVSHLSDAELAEFVRAVRAFVKLGRRIAAPSSTSTRRRRER